MSDGLFIDAAVEELNRSQEFSIDSHSMDILRDQTRDAIVEIEKRVGRIDVAVRIDIMLRPPPDTDRH